MKKYTLFLIAIILFLILCVPTYAEDTVEVSINACRAGEENIDEKICSEMKSLFGSDSTVQYSMVETEICKNKTSIIIDDQHITVYVSDELQTEELPKIFNLSMPESNHEVLSILQDIFGKSALYSFTLEPYHQFNIPIGITINGEEVTVFFDREFSKDTEVSKCIVDDTLEGMICKNMQMLYGKKNNVKYNTVKTDECRYELALELADQNVLLYISHDDEYKSENIEQTPVVQVYTIEDGLHRGFPDKFIIEKVLNAVGDYETYSYSWSKTNETPYKAIVSLNDKRYTIYLSIQPTETQLDYLVDFNQHSDKTLNETNEDVVLEIKNDIKYLYITFFVVFVILLFTIIVLFMSRRSLSDRIDELETKNNKRW
jgi:hypothetical protein